MNSTDWLAKWAYYTPEKLFLREYNRGLEWTYSQFNHCTNTLASRLIAQYGIEKGDRIAVYSKNRAEYVLLFLSCIKIGAILVPLNFRLTPRELNTLISDAEPKLFFFENSYFENVNELSSLKGDCTKLEIESITNFLLEVESASLHPGWPVANEDDVVMILYTAGTTGLSKGVMITHKMLFWNAINTGLRLDITSLDHTQGYAPFFHTGGWNVLFTPFFLHGASHTLLQSFDAELILKLIEKEKSTILFGVPTMLQMMSDLPYFEKADLSSLRYAIVGGAPMPIPLINLWHDKGVYIRQGYGLTEVGPNCFSLHQKDAIRKKGSIGFPNFFVEAKILSPEGTECGPDEIGELCLKSPVVTPGYWRKEEETKNSIINGFFHTGDLVKKDIEGYYYIVDRKKNMYISGGENVYPAEIEAFLFTNHSIKEVAVIGVPDERWGEVGAAFIVPQKEKELSETAVQEFFHGKMAKYKIPKYIHFIDVLPKTDAGKINKIKLREIHQSLIHNNIQ